MEGALMRFSALTSSTLWLLTLAGCVDWPTRPFDMATCPCEGGLVCNWDSGGCVPCTAHSECTASAVCDRVSGDAPAAAGRCLTAAELIYADPTGLPNADGSRAHPVSLDRALALYGDQGRKRVRLAPGRYPIPASWPTGQLALYGPDDEAPARATLDASASVARYAVLDASTNPLLVQAGAALTVDQVFIDGNGGPRGVRCEGGSLKFWRSRVQGTANSALFANGCDMLDVQESRIVDNRQKAIHIENHCAFQLRNNLIARNGAEQQSYAVIDIYQRRDQGCARSDELFVMNTIANNRAKADIASAVACTGRPRALQASLIVGNLRSLSGSQIDGCSIDQALTVLGKDDTMALGQPAETSHAPTLSEDFLLLPGDLEAQTCCIDKVPARGALCPAGARDLLGAARPAGPACDVGAYEAR